MAKKTSTRGRKRQTKRVNPRTVVAARLNPYLADLSTRELQAELARRRSDLISQRDALEISIAEIGRFLGGYQPHEKLAAGKKTSSRLKTRSQRGKGARAAAGGRVTLASTVASILDGKEMGIAEIQDAVKKSGYKSKSANFRTLLTLTLSQNDRFARVARGVYKLAK